MTRHIPSAATATAVVLLGLTACTGASTSAPRSVSGVEKTFFVASERKPCTGVGPMECLQVREAPDQPWKFFYSSIEGFTHEPGFAYELRVREEPVPNPPADGSSLRWRLLKIVSKQAVGQP